MEPTEVVRLSAPVGGVCMTLKLLSKPVLVLVKMAVEGAEGFLYLALMNSSSSFSLRLVIESPNMVHTSFFSWWELDMFYFDLNLSTNLSCKI